MKRFDDFLLDQVRSSVPISDLIGRYVTWDRKKSQPGRGDWWAPCCFHAERSASFHCEDQKGRFHCFGCGASGNHFRFLMELSGLSFPQAVEEVASLGGVKLPTGSGQAADPAEAAERRAQWETKKRRERQAIEAEEEKRRMSAGAIWKATQPTPGTLADVYAIARGLPAWGDPNIRFHPNLWHDLARVTRPAVVARVQGPDGKGIAVWRIYTKPDGTDKAFGKSAEHPAKIGKGPAAGGAVRLGGEAETIGIGEGIETCRAAYILDGRWPVWAGLSTSGIISFDPPEFVRRVVIYPDGDKPRRKDGIDYGPPGMEAALNLRERLLRRGLACDICEPPVNGDYLDVLLSRSR